MIICFSGTGNSRYVSQYMASYFNDRVVEITATTIDNPPLLELAPDEKTIWVFPIYSWGIPPVVKELMERISIMQSDDCSRHYLVCTCGDDVGLTHRQWRCLIKKHGWNPVATFSVQMPNSYTLMKGFDVDPKRLEDEKLDAVPSRLNAVMELINGDFCGDDVVSGSWAWLKTHLIYPYFVRFCMSPKPFHCTDDCIGCGKCARECPLDNIEMDDNSRPQWGDRCALCLRCYHTCPDHAVAYGKATANKGQYLHPVK